MASCTIGGMDTPQGGIFALGTASHAYLEFDLRSARDGVTLVREISALREPRTTMGGVNLVAGFRPELWRAVAPGDVAVDVTGFNQDVVGLDGLVMPATQHDAVLWLSGSAYDVVFDVARGVVASLDGLATVAEEASSWPYRHDRDLTGFIDGTENPSLVDAPQVALVPDGHPGAGGRVARRQHRPGTIRQGLPAQHALRHRHRARHHVRGLQRRAAALVGDAGQHGRADRRHPRRAHALHPPAHRRVLLRPLDRGPAAARRRRRLW